MRQRVSVRSRWKVSSRHGTVETLAEEHMAFGALSREFAA